jgi:hypothetical protein
MKAHTHIACLLNEGGDDDFKGGSCKYGMTQDGSRYQMIWKAEDWRLFVT